MNGADRPLICALRGPLTLITLGVLFALNNFTPWGFQQTWPVLLIVFGLLSLMRRAATPAQPYPMGPTAAPPYQAPPPGSYRHSQYNEPAPGAPNTGSGPAKGGFGSSGTPGPSGNQGGSPNQEGTK